MRKDDKFGIQKRGGTLNEGSTKGQTKPVQSQKPVHQALPPKPMKPKSS